MSLTVNALTYNVDTARTPDIQRYNGPSNSFSGKDYIDLKRSAPKPTSTTLGYAKAESKLTRTMTDGTDPVGDGIIYCSVSFPVEATTAQKEAMVTDLATWLLTTAADDALVAHDIVQ